MINYKKKFKIPKIIRSFYYKDISFNIENYVLDKNIVDIPGNGNLMQSAINMRKNFYSLLVIFVILTILQKSVWAFWRLYKVKTLTSIKC